MSPNLFKSGLSGLGKFAFDRKSELPLEGIADAGKLFFGSKPSRQQNPFSDKVLSEKETQSSDYSEDWV